MDRPLASATFSLGQDAQQGCSVPFREGGRLSEGLVALKGLCMDILKTHLEANSISTNTTDDPMPWEGEDDEDDEEAEGRREKANSRENGDSRKRGGPP